MNINTVCLTGNLTRDPELRQTTGGTDVCSLRVAVNDRRKDSAGDWVDVPYYFNVTVFAGQARSCAQYLERGRGIAVQGRLTWREWEDRDTGKKREAVEVVADKVQFLGDNKPRDARPAESYQEPPVAAAPAATPAAAADDDIPF